jgi:SpoVK/Ycf46/Vps4 family AAA+-type ATPase
MDSVPPNNNGNSVGNGGMFQQLMAVQSIQAIQNMFANKDGGAYQNAASYAIVACIDVLKRLADASVNSLIDNRINIVMFLGRTLKNGWFLVAGALVSVFKLSFLTRLLGIRRWRSCGSETKEEIEEKEGNGSRADTIVAPTHICVEGLATLRDWEVFLATPEIAFDRSNDFVWQRKDATSTRFVESIENIRAVFTEDEEIRETRKVDGGQRTSRSPLLYEAWIEGRVETEWEILKHRSVFDDSKAWHENRLMRVDRVESTTTTCPSFDPSKMKNMTTLLHLVPYRKFVEAIEERLRDPNLFTVVAGTSIVKIVGVSYNFGDRYNLSSYTERLFDLERAGMTFRDAYSRAICGVHLTILIKMVSLEGSHTARKFETDSRLFGAPLTKIKGVKFCEFFNAGALGNDMLEWNIPQSKEVADWMARQMFPSLQNEKLSPAAKKETYTVNVRMKNEPRASCDVDDHHTTSLTVRTLKAWQAFLAKSEDDYDVKQKHNGSNFDTKDGSGAMKYMSKTYSLQIHSREEVKLEPNPEHEAFEEKMRMFDSGSTEDNEDVSNNAGDDYSRQPDDEKNSPSRKKKTKEASKGSSYAAFKKMALFESRPDKHIRHVTIKKSVVQELINETRRDFSSLYLRERDEHNLYNCLVNFRDNKAVLAELGIPNKLGVMLYGMPGTGKTSTIAAIATFLKKDIFYLHLDRVRSNADLKMAFDHVFKVHPGGGIIVMEDVDAMTDVVRKREHDGDSLLHPLHFPLSLSLPHHAQTRQRLRMTHSEGEHARTANTDAPLTLEFFLNLLQGSLTVDGSVFVATTNHLDALDPAFYRKGRFDVSVDMLPSDDYQIVRIYRRFFGRSPSNELLQRIPKGLYTPAEIIAQFAQYLLRADTVDDATILAPFLT